MNKTAKVIMKITTGLMIVCALFFAFEAITGGNLSLAADPGTITKNLKTNDINGNSTNDITGVASKIISIIWVVSIVVSVVVLMVIGLKFIFGSVEEKAEYKKSLVPVVVGIALILSATSLVNFLFGGFSSN